MLFLPALLTVACDIGQQAYRSWEVYGGSEENIKYSALDEIDTTNVSSLKLVWEYASGEASETNMTDMKTNPIIIDGVLYGLNPQLKLFALDAASGEELWAYKSL